MLVAVTRDKQRRMFANPRVRISVRRNDSNVIGLSILQARNAPQIAMKQAPGTLERRQVAIRGGKTSFHCLSGVTVSSSNPKAALFNDDPNLKVRVDLPIL